MDKVEAVACGPAHELRVDAAIIRDGIDGVRGPINREALAGRMLRYADAIDALQAEVAEARDGWHMANGTAELAMRHRDEAEARATRAEAEAASLREAIQDAANRIRGRAKWGPCDCGCNSDKPVDAVSVAYVRAASMARAALQERGE